MGKKFEENVIDFLDLLHYTENVGVADKFIKKNFRNKSDFNHLIRYLEKKDLIIWLLYKNKNVFQISDTGIDFLIERKKEKRQENFNKMIAFTGAIIALNVIYSVIFKIITPENSPVAYWVILMIFSIFFLMCISPLFNFIFQIWKKETFGR
jgi:hypothetical protein